MWVGNSLVYLTASSSFAASAASNASKLVDDYDYLWSGIYNHREGAQNECVTLNKTVVFYSIFPKTIRRLTKIRWKAPGKPQNAGGLQEHSRDAETAGCFQPQTNIHTKALHCKSFTSMNFTVWRLSEIGDGRSVEIVADRGTNIATAIWRTALMSVFYCSLCY